MLVLTRKLGEKILIDNGIEIKVVAVNGSRVQLGFKAPENLRIIRSEKLSSDDAWYECFVEQTV